MKTILTLFIALALSACSKEEPTCQTCQENVLLEQENQPDQTYIESSTEYCNGEWEDLNGDTVKTQGSVNGNWWKKRVITTCQ